MDILGALRDPEFRRGVRQGILDAANRGIAAAFGAPVDIATMVARPFGYSTPERQVVGSSEWLGKQMEDLGMVSTARNPVAEMLASVIMPAGVTTQGKRLYELEQAAARNLAAPRTLNTPGYGGQRGALYLTEGLPNQGKDLIQSEAKRLADLLKQKGFNVDLQHSGSAAGPSSYLKVFDPQTGRFIEKEIRISGHSKGPFNSQNIINVNADEFDEVLNLAESMRSLGKSKVFLQQEKAQELIQQGVKPKLAYKQAAEILERNNQPMGLMGAPKQTGLQELTTLNPTGSVFSNYDPISRAIAPLGKNITTLDKTMGGLADDTVTIYRGAPKTQKTINPGDFITTDAQLARDYAGTGHVISQKVRKKDILDDMLEPLGGEYIYRPAK